MTTPGSSVMVCLCRQTPPGKSRAPWTVGGGDDDRDPNDAASKTPKTRNTPPVTHAILSEHEDKDEARVHSMITLNPIADEHHSEWTPLTAAEHGLSNTASFSVLQYPKEWEDASSAESCEPKRRMFDQTWNNANTSPSMASWA